MFSPVLSFSYNMASPPIAELTAQVVTLTDQVTTLTNRLSIAEQNQALNAAQAGSMRGGGGDAGVFDKKRLYPKELKEASSFPIVVGALPGVA